MFNTDSTVLQSSEKAAVIAAYSRDWEGERHPKSALTRDFFQ